MPAQIVGVVAAVAIRRKIGTTVTFINQSTVDVYFDSDQNRLNASPVGSVPDGTKLPAESSGVPGSIQFSEYPGVMYVRSASDTQIEVQP